MGRGARDFGVSTGQSEKEFTPYGFSEFSEEGGADAHVLVLDMKLAIRDCPFDPPLFWCQEFGVGGDRKLKVGEVSVAEIRDR